VTSPNSGGGYNSWPGGDHNPLLGDCPHHEVDVYVTYETCSIASSDTNRTTTTVRRRRRKATYDRAIRHDGAFSMFAPTAVAVNLCALTSSGISPTTANDLDSLDARKCKRVTAKQTNVGKVRTVVPRSQSANEPRGGGGGSTRAGGRDDDVAHTRSQSSQPRVRKAGRGRFLIEMNSDDETDVWLVRPQLGPQQSHAEEVEPIPDMEPLPLNAHDEACDEQEIGIIEEMWLHTTSL
jgi:hypothetical protein